MGLELRTWDVVSSAWCIGIDELLDAIVTDLPPPSAQAGQPARKGGGPKEGPLRALVFDSFYDPSKGVVLVAVLRVSNAGCCLLSAALSGELRRPFLKDVDE